MARERAVGVALAAVLVLLSAVGASAMEAQPKPAREMTTKLHHHPLQLRVHVIGYQDARTYLQKKTCATCDWDNVGHKNTSAHGRVRYDLGVPATGSWYYRVMTPERPHYRESYSRVAKTFLH